MRKFFLATALLLTGWLAAAEYYYTLNARARGVYADVTALELDLAEAGLRALRAEEPRNLVTYHLDSYVDFFRLYLSGDESLDGRLAERFDRRIELLEQGDDADPYYRYALAEAHLHRSLIDLRFERHLAAFRHLNRAHKYLRDNVELFPDFLLTYKDLGLVHAAVGSIPPQYKWGVELLSSLSGTISEGRRELALALTAEDSPFRLETEVLAAFLELYLADRPEAAYRRVKALHLSHDLRRTNNLHLFVLANLAMRTDRNAEALRLLEGQQRGGSAADFPYLDFMLGQTKLRDLDPQARVHFRSFLLRYAGRHFREEALQKIAWSHLLEGNERAYHATMAEITGGSRAGGDESAQREAASGKAPHTALLRARLLFDGGYFERARTQVQAVEYAQLREDDKLEYLYRSGRILDGLNERDQALLFYNRTISKGREHPAYFACNAALRAGLMEEKRGHTEAARRYFETCLDIHPEEYRTGLHLLAKAGLDRLSR